MKDPGDFCIGRKEGSFFVEIIIPFLWILYQCIGKFYNFVNGIVRGEMSERALQLTVNSKSQAGII